MLNTMKIAFGNDHAAFKIRSEIIKFLESLGHTVTDFGFECSDSCDYPDYAYKVAKSVASGENDKGILICGTGIGMSISANKVNGIRAALCWDENTASLASAHNNANVLCLGARTASLQDLCKHIKIWFDTPFEQRHTGRIDKIRQIEKEQKVCK